MLDDEAGARFVWTVDLLPDTLAWWYGEAMDAGLAAIGRAFGVGLPAS